jgi:hypothetical protein
MLLVIFTIIVAEPHHADAVPTMGKNIDAAPAPALTINQGFFKKKQKLPLGKLFLLISSDINCKEN